MLKKYDLFTDGLSQSLIKAFLVCPKKFSFAVQGWESVEMKTKMSVAFGSYFHHNIEQWMKGKDRLYIFDKALARTDVEYMKAVNHVLFDFYKSIYKKDMLLKDKQPEFEFIVKHKNIPLRGKIDLVFTGGIKETKTKGQISEEKIDLLLVNDFQSLFYLWVINYKQVKTDNIGGKVIYDVIRFPRYKEKGKELTERLFAEVVKTPEHFFYRWETDFNFKDLDTFQCGLDSIIDSIVQCFTSQHYPKSYNCDMGFGCAYIGLCTKGDCVGLCKKKRLFEELTA